MKRFERVPKVTKAREDFIITIDDLKDLIRGKVLAAEVNDRKITIGIEDGALMKFVDWIDGWNAMGR